MVICADCVSQHNPEGIPLSWGVSIAWMSSLYHPDQDFEPSVAEDGSIQVGRDPEDEPEGPSPSRLAWNDVLEHPEWRAWLMEHFIRHDIFLMLSIEDDPPKRKFTHGYSKKRQQHSFTHRLAAQEFLDRDQRSVIRVADCETFAFAAEKLDLPAPPPALIETPS